MVSVTDVHAVDPGRISLLIECCIQAYNAFDSEDPSRCKRVGITPPDGFELLDHWSGVDAVFGFDKTVECFGLLFRSTTPPWRYVFAFRGTSSALDALDDCGVEPHCFVPFDTTMPVPADAHVESGFHSVYRNGNGSVAPMQHQLFALIDKYRQSDRPIDEILVTGHSLGAALSQLFTLDLTLSRPSLRTMNVNFAPPRVGNSAFVTLCENHQQQPTLRVQNTHDMVPHLPPAELGFRHTRAVLLIAFHRSDEIGRLDLKASHSVVNYQAVIRCAEQQEKGICAGRHLPASDGKEVIFSEPPRVDSELF